MLTESLDTDAGIAALAPLRRELFKGLNPLDLAARLHSTVPNAARQPAHPLRSDGHTEHPDDLKPAVAGRTTGQVTTDATQPDIIRFTSRRCWGLATSLNQGAGAGGV